MIKKLLLLLIVFLTKSSSLLAQSDIEMADVMRSEGKIYVVVAVAATVMVGILVYLISIDRKVSALEKKLRDKK